MKMRMVTFAAAMAGVALLACSYARAEENAGMWMPSGPFPEEIDDESFDGFAKVYSTMEFSHGEENFKKYCPKSIHQVCGTTKAALACTLSRL